MTELHNGIPAFHAKTRKAWRAWLAKNHATQQRVWLIMYHKNSGVPSVPYAEAVEEALCFGWVDSKANKRDADSAYQYFAQRKPNSIWSQSNRVRVDRLIAEGLMTPAGLALVDHAKRIGTWEAHDDVQNGVVPGDLHALFDRNPAAFENFLAFPPSSKRIILEWIRTAKREETRRKRLEETVALAARNIRANHYRQ